MSAEESDIVHEVGGWFVLATPKRYEVCRNGLVCATVDSTYSKDPDGLAIAIARANYKAKTGAMI